MRYVGIIKSGDETTNVETLNANSPRIERILPVKGVGSRGFITGFVKNNSSLPMSVNFYMDRRESQDILLLGGETLEVTHQPADRLQFESTAGTVEFEYLFRLLSSENEAESTQLMTFTELKKKVNQVFEDFVTYPEYRGNYIRRRVGDDFNRADLNPAGFPDSFYRTITSGGGQITKAQDYLRLQSGTGAISGVGLSMPLQGVINQPLDIDLPVKKIIFDAYTRVVFAGQAFGGLLLSNRVDPEINYQSANFRNMGFQVDNQMTLNYLLISSIPPNINERIDICRAPAHYWIRRY